MDIHRARGNEMLFAPDLAQQVLPRPGMSRMSKKELKKAVLG